MKPITVTDELLDRLLDPADPALRAKVLVDLLDRPEDDDEVQAAREGIPEHPWVRATLAAHHGDGTWGRGFYHKYDGTSWVMLHMGEMGVPSHLPEVQAGVRRLLETAEPVNDIKGIRGEAYQNLDAGLHWKHPIPCLMAHMALVLIRAGHAAHPVTRGALRSCSHRFQEGLGFGCFVVDDSLLPACVMTVPKVLKAFLALPPEARTSEDEALIQGMVAVLRQFRLYQYVPRDAGAWRDWARGASAAQRREAKPRWIAQGRVEPRGPKEGWTRFSFPHSYNSDLLEVLLLVGEADGGRDAAVDAGLEILRSKRRHDGMWNMTGGLNGKMHGQVDRKGKPSPWITYRALLAFKRFGLLTPA